MSEVSRGILSDDSSADREKLVGMLEKAYWMEIETVMSYVANSVNPDGVRAQEIKQSLAEDITEELGHAQQYAQRIKDLGGTVPGSEEFVASQSSLQPPADSGDIVWQWPSEDVLRRAPDHAHPLASQVHRLVPQRGVQGGAGERLPSRDVGQLGHPQGLADAVAIGDLDQKIEVAYFWPASNEVREQVAAYASGRVAAPPGVDTGDPDGPGHRPRGRRAGERPVGSAGHGTGAHRGVTGRRDQRRG